MLTTDHVLRLILHESAAVRRLAVTYAADEYNPDPRLLPKLWAAADRYGSDATADLFMSALAFITDAASVERALDTIETPAGKSATEALANFVAHAPLPLLQAHRERFSGGGRIMSSAGGMIRDRLRLAELSVERVWNETARLSDDWTHAESQRVHAIAMALENAAVPSTEEIERILTAGFDADYAQEYVAIHLVGARKLVPFIEHVAERAKNESSGLDSEAIHALARIGDDRVIEYYQRCWVELDEFDKGMVLESVAMLHTPRAEQFLANTLRSEADETVRTFASMGLCRMVSEQALELVTEMIADGYDRSIIDLEDELIAVATALGRTLPQADAWIAAREERRRRTSENMLSRHSGDIDAEPDDLDYPRGTVLDLDPANFDSDPFQTEPLPDDPDISAGWQPVPERSGPKIGRNEKCSCGSGKKYKKCCGVGQ